MGQGNPRRAPAGGLHCLTADADLEMDPEIDQHWRVTKLGILATRDIANHIPNRRGFGNDGKNAAGIRQVHTVAGKLGSNLGHP